MKKLLCVLLSLLLLMSLAACGSTPANDTPETTQETKVDTKKDETADPDDQGAFSFNLQEVVLTPGAEFDPSALPEADSTFEIESCAGQGTDTVYSYTEAEVTVFDDGNKGAIYSVYLLDPNTATPEGLYLGDEKAQAETLYGTDYEEEDTELVYTKGDSQLRIMVEDGVVTAIEYRLITE